MGNGIVVGYLGIDYDGFLLMLVIVGLVIVCYDGILVVWFGDFLVFYDKLKYFLYGWVIVVGFGMVMIDGKFVVRVGDVVDCGGVL